MDDLLDYFEESYINGYRSNAERRPPLFALNLWKMFHLTFHELYCTFSLCLRMAPAFAILNLVVPFRLLDVY